MNQIRIPPASIPFRTLTLGGSRGGVKKKSLEPVKNTTPWGGGRRNPLEPTTRLYVGAVLHARDVLLAADIRVIGYDLYPNDAGALAISGDDRERAFAALTSNGIQFTTTSPTVHQPSRRAV